MKTIDKDKSKAIGKRIKEEKIRAGLRNKDLCSILYIEDVHSISRLLSGTSCFSDEYIKTLAGTFGVRFNYLKCIDDFRTDEDIENYSKTELTDMLNEYQDIRDTFNVFLKSLGFSIEFVMVANVSRDNVVDHWDDIKKYFTDGANEMIAKLNNAPDKRSIESHLYDQGYVSITQDIVKIELKSIPDDINTNKYIDLRGCRQYAKISIDNTVIALIALTDFRHLMDEMIKINKQTFKILASGRKTESKVIL